MNSKKTLVALSAAIVLGVLGAASVASASDGDRDNGGVSAAQAQRDWVDWQRSLGHSVPGNGYVDNGSAAYGYVPPQQAPKHIKR
jgi:opacity protein-like surface antigen